MICSVSIFVDEFFFKSILSRKNWEGGARGGELLSKVNWYLRSLLMRPITNHAFAQAGFTLHGAPGTLGIFAAIFSQT